MATKRNSRKSRPSRGSRARRRSRHGNTRRFNKYDWKRGDKVRRKSAVQIGADMVGEVVMVTPTMHNHLMSDGVSRAHVRVRWSNGYECRVPEGGLVRAEDHRQADARPGKIAGPERFAARDRVFFEYHCFQSDESCDAKLWHHTRQWAKVLRRIEPPEIDDGIMYAIVFDDGFRYDVFADELTRKPVQHPKARGVVMPQR